MTLLMTGSGPNSGPNGMTKLMLKSCQVLGYFLKSCCVQVNQVAGFQRSQADLPVVGVEGQHAEDAIKYTYVHDSLHDSLITSQGQSKMQKTQGSDEQGLSASVRIPLPKVEPGLIRTGLQLQLYSIGLRHGKSSLTQMMLNQAHEQAAQRLRAMDYSGLEAQALAQIKPFPQGTEEVFCGFIRGEVAESMCAYLSDSILKHMLDARPLTMQEVEAKTLGINITDRLHASFMKRVQSFASPHDNGPAVRPTRLHPLAIAVRIASAKNAGVKRAGASVVANVKAPGEPT